MMQRILNGLAFILLLLAICVLPSCGMGDKPPTEAEVTKFLVKMKEDSAYGDTLRPAKKVEVSVTGFKLGGKTKQQVSWGQNAREVWAVKADVVTKIYLKNGTEQTREHRLASNEAWFFYRDSFGEWAAKYGPM